MLQTSRTLAAIFGLTFAVVFGTHAAQAACTPTLSSPPLAKAGSLISALNPTVAPIQYIDDSGNIVGLDPEFGDAIAERLCLKQEVLSTKFATMIPLAKEGRIDMINSFMFYTPERASQVYMIPYGASTTAILVLKKNADEVNGPEYFSGKRFGTQLGTVDYQVAKATSDELIKAGKPAIDVRTFDTYADVLQALAAGQLDGAFVGTEQSLYYRDKGADFFRIAVSRYSPHVEALAFGNADIAHAVEKALNDMAADGSIEKLFNKYGHCFLPGPYKVTTGPIAAPVCNEIK
jgi:polar amino acid transport system substrate-binding protein